MSGTVEDRRGRVRSALAALVVVALLVPTGMLFLQLRQATADDLDQSRGERDAITYITRLMPLLTALTDVQSTALQGRGATSPALDQAVAAVTEADQQLGADLGTRERWAGLRRTITGLAEAPAGDPAQTLQAHLESTDLLLALFDAVRDNSGLDRDPDSDISHLQQAVAVDLPEAIVYGTRASDLALVLPNLPSGIVKTQVGTGLAAATAGTELAVNRLTDNLQRAVDDTASRTLSSSLLGALDRFRRGVEALVQATAAPTPSAAALTAARGDLTQGLNGLSGTILTETGQLLRTRIDDLENDRLTQYAVAGGAVLLALLGLVILFARRRRTAIPAPARPRGSGSPDGRPDELRADLLAAYTADGDPTRRERSGALR
ncbi:hypothetical protein [Spirilliplanes yamanashiensis]|uniref:Uncharacterized protein n=1 Tax=Spirilliplanes yamanashiensis TaxID=42233 RepID=A0A8J4DHQ8_9ACTN|nr:hypothetical protein [Spirilliplanes yamanashiensis]MDP9814699.1 hypothetical protein [Spirilliplanes yamanashiensis]GIJ02352.1 hypothetical protein Sya03_17040 [Spirilliplanes yamanashiensis]